MSPHVRMNNYLLIENVRRCKALWERSAQEKTELFVRERMWDEIAARMGSTKSIVKARWKNLRDAYRKIIKKQEESDSRWDPRWPYYKHMEFMRDIAKNITPRNQDISIPKHVNAISEDELQSNPSDCGDNSSTIPILSHKDSKRRIGEEILAFARQYQEFDTDKDGQLGENVMPFHAEDDDYQFLLSLYPHFKQVPQSRKLPLRMKIEQVIYEELYVLQKNQTSKTG